MRGVHRVNISSMYLVMLIFLSITGCKSTGAKVSSDSSEILPKDWRTSDPELIDPDFDSDSSSALALSSMWSPEQRRANAIFQYLSAIDSMLGGRVEDAKQRMEASYSLDPNSRSGSQLVEMKILSNDFEDSKDESLRLTLLYPNNVELRIQYASILAATGDLEESYIQLDEVLAKNPKHEDAYLLKSRFLLSEKKQTEALKTLKKLVENVPASSRGWALLARLQVFNKEIKDGLTSSKRAWELQPSMPDLGILYGIALDLNGRREEALKMYESSYKLSSQSLELVQRIVALYQEAGDLGKALEVLDEISQKSGNQSEEVELQRAAILNEMKQYDDAIDVLIKIRKHHPDSDRLTYFLAVSHELKQDVASARSYYQEVPEDSPLKLQSQYREIAFLRREKKFESARQLAISLVSSPRADAGTWLVLVETLIEDNDCPLAIKYADEGIAKFPKNHSLYFTRGVCEEKLQLWAKAELSMRRAIEISPDFAPAMNFLGYMLAEQNRLLDEAEMLVRKALKLRPNDGAYMDSLGWIQFRQGSFAASEVTLKEALRLSPKEGVIMEHLGEVYIKLGRSDEAKTFFLRSLEQELEVRDRNRIQKRIQELGLR
jgi:tetratricopeptide (TPR) repeat protein